MSLNTSRASAWSFGARLVAQISGMLLLLVGARVLSAAELGFFALASAVAMLISRLAEAGWTQYVMAWEGSRLPAATVFWTGLGVASAGGAAGVLGGLGYVWLGGDGPFGWLLASLSALIPFGAVTALQYGILTRDGRIGAIAGITITSDLIALAAGVATLVDGGGVLALLVNRAVMTAVSLAASVAVARWVPPFALERAAALAAVSFVRRLTATQLIEFAKTYGAEFVLALVLGAAEVGIYRLASRVVGAISELFSEPLRMLSWATLSRARAKSDAGWKPGADGERIVFSTALLALPSFIGLSLVAGRTVQVLMGEDWAAAAPVIAVLAIARLFALPSIVAEPMLVLVGQVRLLPLITVLSSAVSVLLLLGLAPYGPVGAATSQLLSALLTLPVVIWAQVRYAEVRWASILHELKAAAAAVAVLAAAVAAVSWKASEWHLPSWLSLSACIVVGGTIYAGLIFLSYRAYCRTVLLAFLRP
ncbi:hypothetical protein OPKNFCMD_5540 [Methylobacterium crusticola]|uniref:Lipopolysaccharide biosynthesis protein n=1 Tax=Methylobacterium crusticola TaxID=1697972 RepID=A0ABQ4R571_9HYPH|nr:oligosaccharide flippase family protein [Methylobacterium crusticola]GJD52773.1 hypothetical protein OPKNFCMD_5540 [Methylobacterium crusticola]